MIHLNLQPSAKRKKPWTFFWNQLDNISLEFLRGPNDPPWPGCRRIAGNQGCPCACMYCKANQRVSGMATYLGASFLDLPAVRPGKEAPHQEQFPCSSTVRPRAAWAPLYRAEFSLLV